MRRLGLFTLAAALMLVIVVSAVSATVFVKPTGSDTSDGSTWDLAKATVQAGVNTASSLGGGEVWVAAGTYKERITMKAGVALYGGFAGTETDPALRDWKNNVTTLDASRKGSVVTVSTGPGVSVVIDGFTITNGQAANGGGVTCYNSSATICNNRIYSNKATVSGGGVFCDGASYSVVITGNTILSNSAPSGGGVNCSGAGSCELSWNMISSNKATAGSGGGILSSLIGMSLLNDNIKSNTASLSGGGIYCTSHAAITSCLVSANTAVSGGGVGCLSDLDMTNNTVVGNKALVKNTDGTTSPGDGGALYCAADVLLNLRQNIVSLNNPGIFLTSSLSQNLAGNCIYGNSGYDFSGVADTAPYMALDPKFVDQAAGNYHLLPSSPCVNAGDPLVLTSSQDVDGLPRVSGGVVDIGAYEWAPSAPTNLSISPSSGILPIGTKFTVTTKFSDNDGYGNITTCNLLLNTSLSEVAAVDLMYDATKNLLYMKDDTGTTWTGARAPGSPYVIANSYCLVYCSGTSITGSGATLTVKWNLVLRPPSCGLAYLAWMQSSDSYGLQAPWQQMASLSVSPNLVHEPVNVSLTPHSGLIPTDTKLTFTSVYSDGDGAADLAGGHVLFSPDGGLMNAAYTKYDAILNKLYLRNDTATSWTGGYSPGAPNILQNAVCKLYCADTTVVMSGDTMTVNWVMSFKTAKAGLPYQAYLLTWDDGGLFADWKKIGTITLVPGGAANQLPTNVSLAPSSGPIQSGAETIMTSVHSDPDGYANLAACQLLISDTLSEAYAADFKYDANANKLYVKNDSGTSWSGGYAPGTAKIIQNSFCSLNCANTVVTSSVNSLTINWAIKMKSITAGSAVFAWLQTVDDATATDAWEQMGTFNIQ